VGQEKKMECEFFFNRLPPYAYCGVWDFVGVLCEWRWKKGIDQDNLRVYTPGKIKGESREIAKCGFEYDIDQEHQLCFEIWMRMYGIKL